ncbi:Tubulin-specific chaperone D [Golovinomyces cichoracearum]|uniref:Tubulin-specific chaperone D n=1 Tax=Golovinomyces cichoracearum TaxID=62708 RepID=A0A420I795_9PEZI|nr:Tubulin-specific chaperone D [Golovinomyces cichoracearum]
MDITEEEQDVKLQRASAELLSDITNSLHPLLWKTAKSGSTKLRARVRERDLSRILSMIDTFQELPQLLDLHLERFISLLAKSFLAHLQFPPVTSSKNNRLLLVPSSKATCQLLYRFCKVRGEKIIVRFLNTEIKYIELLVSALEERTSKCINISSMRDTIDQSDCGEDGCWEETYILLLWLSQLLLAPFDLASISSDNSGLMRSEIKGLALPSDSPGIALRIIPLAIHGLSLSSKEKDAAKYLLVRFSLRKDMKCNGTMESLIRWAVSQIQPDAKEVKSRFLGALSFLAGILASSVGTKDANNYILTIYEQVKNISFYMNPQFKAVNNDAVARKTILKIFRSIAVLTSQKPEDQSNFTIVESVIGHILDSIADPVTPVRLAASKALSIITLKLPFEMADEVVDTILSDLDKNLLWEGLNYVQGNLESRPQKTQHENSTVTDMSTIWTGIENVSTVDFSRVDVLRWHGIMMTLSHLVYRRSIRPQNLSPTLSALRLGLLFEQRSASGTSVGSNVRDAACFGIWSLARKYSTSELQSIVIQKEKDIYVRKFSTSNLQTLASDLVVSATLDSAGNIRRGASAALQELIGRHPDSIEKGIELVQIVDYHAIALRIRAIETIALGASALSDQYRTAILQNLFGWRGIRNSDKFVRRASAIVIGRLVLAKQSQKDDLSTNLLVHQMTDHIASEILNLKLREAEERHGLILSFTAIVQQFLAQINKQSLRKYVETAPTKLEESDTSKISKTIRQNLPSETPSEEFSLIVLVRSLLRGITSIVQEVCSNQASYRLPKLSAEAVCQMLLTSFKLVKLDLIFQQIELKQFKPQNDLMSNINERSQTQEAPKAQINLIDALDIEFSLLNSEPLLAVEQYEAIVTAYHLTNGPSRDFIKHVKNFFDQVLKITDEDLADIVSVAAAYFGFLCGPEHSWFPDWKKNAFDVDLTNQKGQNGSYIQTILRIPTKLYNLWNSGNESSSNAIHRRWQSIKNFESRIIMMRCISTSFALRECPFDYIDLIKSGLDDYTTTHQGDVGSLVRIESIKTAAFLWGQNFGPDHGYNEEEVSNVFDELVPRILRLASEKLDRVRIEAKLALLIFISHKPELSQIYSRIKPLSVSSKQYFRCLLEIQCILYAPEKESRLFNDFIRSYVTSADGGSEDTIYASRTALVDFCRKRESKNSFPHSTFNELFVLNGLLCTIKSNLLRHNVPALEVLAFLISFGVVTNDSLLQATHIFDLVEKALGNSKNLKKLEAGIKVLGALLEVEGSSEDLIKFKQKAICCLTQKLTHQYPKIRNATADELFFRTKIGKGIDWTSERKTHEMETIKECLLNLVGPNS